VTPRCDLGTIVDIVASSGNTVADILKEPDTFYTVSTVARIQTFPGLESWDAQLGFHFNVPAVLIATCVFLPVSGVLLFSHLWERVWKESVFGLVGLGPCTS
jgi:hypothetical protein